MGVPVEAFVAEAERYNSFVKSGVDEDFGKPVFGGIHAGNCLDGRTVADCFAFSKIAGENAAK